jgi:thioredoxin-dependent peroxiredoxin
MGKTQIMKSLIVAAAIAALATPALAALPVGGKAPDFKAPAFMAGKEQSFDLAAARKKGPVVVYFFPAAFTKGCDVEAHLFSEASEQFKASGATLVGVTSGNLDRLAEFSKDTERCAGKFPVAGDPGAGIAKKYDAILAAKPDWSSRTSYVIAPNGDILLSYTDMNPQGHIDQTLAAVKKFKGAK